jgi:YidC/Oxa1 family membrane protein insertase
MPNFWDLLIINPMINSLLFLYSLLFNNLTLTIIVFTVLIRAITFPLTWQQQKSSKAMQELQQSEEWKKIQEKHAGDREKLSQEQMKLWQKAGVNPLGGCLPLVIQFPILIGLYQAITNAIAASPAQLVTLSTHVYSFFPNVAQLIPLDNRFLWMNLGLPDPYYVMPVLVVLTSWVQSKVITPPAADPQAAQMTQTTALTTTLMFGWFSLTFASGLSIYFVVSNILGVLQYSITNPINWRNIFNLGISFAPPAEDNSRRSSRDKERDKTRKKKS